MQFLAFFALIACEGNLSNFQFRISQYSQKNSRKVLEICFAAAK